MIKKTWSRQAEGHVLKLASCLMALALAGCQGNTRVSDFSAAVATTGACEGEMFGDDEPHDCGDAGDGASCQELRDKKSCLQTACNDSCGQPCVAVETPDDWTCTDELGDSVCVSKGYWYCPCDAEDEPSDPPFTWSCEEPCGDGVCGDGEDIENCPADCDPDDDPACPGMEDSDLPDVDGDGEPDDSDGDGVPDGCDECEGVDDSDLGSAPDSDGDGTPDSCDKCEGMDDAELPDSDGDGEPDDSDEDGTPDACDKCEGEDDSTVDTTDTDGDGTYDSCDKCEGEDDSTVDPTDSDEDGTYDSCDQCPGVDDADMSSAPDSDNDGEPDACDCDDGVCSVDEAENNTCPGECECGNNSCDPGEDASSCPGDCAPCSAPDGEPTAPACSERCSTENYRWSFWVTQYNVGNTWGNGEHQGIRVLGHKYKHDSRFWPDGRPKSQAKGNQTAALKTRPWRHDQSGLLWKQGMSVSTQRQFEMRTTNPGGESSAWVPVSQQASWEASNKLCGYEQVLRKDIYNHGRSLAETVPTDYYYASKNLIPIRQLTAGTATETWTSASSPHHEDVQECMEVLDDGFCDSVCGNCSYVLPDAAHEDGWDSLSPLLAVSRKVWASVTEGVKPVMYVNGGKAVVIGGNTIPASTEREDWGISYWDTLWPDPFVHCSAGDEQEIKSTVLPLALNWGDQFRVVTGRYGHNSNSDAEAEYLHFRNCMSAPKKFLNPTTSNACGACGVARATAHQTPCVDFTNRAASSWGRTKGIHNVDDKLGVYPGGGSSRFPQCGWGGFRVAGM